MAETTSGFSSSCQYLPFLLSYYGMPIILMFRSRDILFAIHTFLDDML
jgi:hypothetical protein